MGDSKALQLSGQYSIFLRVGVWLGMEPFAAVVLHSTLEHLLQSVRIHMALCSPESGPGQGKRKRWLGAWRPQPWYPAGPRFSS